MNRNEPAFPVSEEETDRIVEGVEIYPGLTKLEYAAIKMAAAVASNPKTMDELIRRANNDEVEHVLAMIGTDHANALFDELEKDK